MPKYLIVLPCCSRKIDGGNQQVQRSTYFEDANNVPDLIRDRAQNMRQHAAIIENNDQFLTAWERYDGVIYRRLKAEQRLIDELMHHNLIDIVIVSALYGLLNYDTPINKYNLKMNAGGLAGLWGTSVSSAINNYITSQHITETHLFLANAYSIVTTRLAIPNSVDGWVYGLRGVNNINNAQANKIIDLLRSIKAKHLK
jgi:hypothetical protein